MTYGLDPVGNRLSQTSSLPGIPTAAFTYDADDRMLSTEQYDPNGNTTVSGARTFAYDFENRVKSMNNGAVTIVYDGDGKRVAKTVGGITTHYLLDDLNPTGYPQVIEELVNSTVQRTYTYGTQRISENQTFNNSWVPSFYGYDGSGSVRQPTDGTGVATDTYDYDGWGNAVHITGSTTNFYLYRGEQYDPDLRLYDLRARFFNPLSGRFLTRDPEPGRIKAPATLHRYVYAGDDPVSRVDPSGRSDQQDYLSLTRILNSFAMYPATVGCVAGLLAAHLTIDIYDWVKHVNYSLPAREDFYWGTFCTFLWLGGL